MKKLLILFSVLFALGAAAQSTTITSTIIDPLGNSWGYGTVTAVFQASPGASNKPVWSGGAFNPVPPTVNLDSAGHFTMTLPSTNFITPSGGTWIFSVCPNSSQPCAILPTPVIGSTLDINPLITAANGWPTQLVISTPIAKVYNVDQTFPPPLSQGGMLYDTTTQSMLVYTNTGWQPFATVGSGVPILSNPPGSQTITQMANTFFNINTSGTGGIALTTGSGGFDLNGYQVLTKSSGLFQAIVSVDDYGDCTTGTYDQTCLTAALTANGNNTLYLFGRHSYQFVSQAVLSNLSNVSIIGDGPATIISGNFPTYAEYVIQCSNCSNFTIKNLQFKSNITPTLIASSQLPSAATYVVLERNGGGAQTPVTAYTIASNVVCFTGTNTYAAGNVVFLNGFLNSTFLNFTNFVVQSSGLSSSQFCGSSPFFTHSNTSSAEPGFSQLGSGTGYMPGVNDGDVVPTGSGGGCTANCLTAGQSTEAFDAGLQCLSCTNVEITGVTGNYYTLTFYGGNSVNIHDNQIAGGTGFGCVGFWPSIAITGETVYSNNDISVHNNTISACSYSGVELANTQHFSITDNIISNIGESGVKTWQDFTNHYASWTAVDGSVAGNVVTGTWFDALDISFDLLVAPLSRHIAITGNHLDYNRGTQTISDGVDMTYVGNEGFGNGADAQLAYCNSTITGNSFMHNASLYPTVGGYGAELTLVPSALCGGNIISSNTTDTGGIPGVVGILDNNVSSLASYFFGNFEETGNNNISSNNFQSGNITQAGSSIGEVQGSSLNLLGTSNANLFGPSVAGNYTYNLPAVSGTLLPSVNTGALQTTSTTACTLSATALSNCGVSVTLPVAEPDTAYYISGCMVVGANVNVMMGTAGSLTTTGFTVGIISTGAANTTPGTVECTVIHH